MANTIVVLEEQTIIVGSDSVGPQGPQGPQGPTGIHVGPTPPADTTKLWVNTA